NTRQSKATLQNRAGLKIHRPDAICQNKRSGNQDRRAFRGDTETFLEERRHCSSNQSDEAMFRSTATSVTVRKSVELHMCAQTLSILTRACACSGRGLRPHLRRKLRPSATGPAETPADSIWA